MHKSMTILYEVHDNLYVNLTNKCPCSCTFCLRQTRDHMEQSDSLWLEHEPDFDEVIAAFQAIGPAKLAQYQELVFCGFGEPTERLDLLLKVAAYVKEHYAMSIRINTNGLGDLIHHKDITPSLKGLIDTLSISLNTPNQQKYHNLVRSKFGDISFQAMLDFAKNSKRYVPQVILTTVSTTLTSEEESQCQRICDDLCVTYRIRPWED
ncbi:MAG: TatD family nuclease-associated radical SAM protein [Lachnospiraceae bacterium]|nr:TatD family nuclease-associated radical SAM protein [Lachnospiraceae bacterium]